jgi:hypothetical protein
MLLVWVVALLVISLRAPGDQVMCTWNVTLCVVLLLPVSHLAYTLYGLPVLWLWVAYLLESRRLNWRQLIVPAILSLWWIVQTRAWPGPGSSPAIGSLRYCVVFAANLAACTASVLGARFVHVEQSQVTGVSLADGL